MTAVTMKRATIAALLLRYLASAVAGASLLRGVDSPIAGVSGLDNEVARAPASGINDINGMEPRRRKLADVTNKFQMKLWYTPGIKWEYRGKHWCWQCVGQKGCNPGDTIITQPCRDIRAQRWQAVQVKNKNKYVQFRTRNVSSGPDDLCVTRNHEQGEKYSLQECDEDDDKQLFLGFEADEDEKFALNPKVAVDDGRDRCVTMNHRPRSNGDYNGDKIYDQKCWKAEKTDTMYWEIRWIDDEGWEEEEDYEVDEDDYDGDNDEKGLRDIAGDVSEPVGRCSGDCDSGKCMNECVRVKVKCARSGYKSFSHEYFISLQPRRTADDDCRGDLVCFERKDGDKGPVPGCTERDGRGSSGWDYWYVHVFFGVVFLPE